ncbi:MAG: hypothetical protein R3F50_20520 [Gammaproteobacteria bacterium]
MKKTVWIAFGIALVLVNLFAWLMEQSTGFSIPMILRLMLVLGITMGTIVFAGAFALVNKMDEERPLTGHGQDTLQKRPANQPEPPARPDTKAD